MRLVKVLLVALTLLTVLMKVIEAILSLYDYFFLNAESLHTTDFSGLGVILVLLAIFLSIEESKKKEK